MSAPALLYKPANLTTLKVIRGETRGQYHITLSKTDPVTDFFAGLPRAVDHEGLRIDVWTEPAPGEGGDVPPWKLTIRRMSEGSSRALEWYIASQQPGSTHPLWRPGTGPSAATPRDEDRVVLLRTADDRFFAGWLRGEQVAELSTELRARVEKRRTGVAALSEEEVGEVLALLGQPPEEASPPELEETTALEETSLPSEPPEDDEPEGQPSEQEGQPRLVQHVRRERSRRLRREKIKRAGESPRCEACGFDFAAVYGERGKGFIECHHLIPVSELDPATPTRLEDLALLCANCHRMVHVGLWLSVEELRELLAASR